MTFWTDTLGAELRFHDAGGWRTRSLEAGDSGDHVICIGGLTGHVEGFVRNVVPLAERGLRVHAIDTLGHGWTAKPEDVTYHAPVFTEHLLRFMDAIGAERAHIVGQSLGGWIGLYTALKHPDRIGRIAHVTGAGILLDDEARKEESQAVHAKVQDVTRKAVEAPTRESVRTRLEWLMADPASVTDELVEARYRIYTLPDSRRVMPKLVAEQPSPENRAYLLTEADLAAIPHETLVLWSDKNPTTPAEVGRRASEILPNGHFELITGAGHWLMFEQPEEFNRIVGDFLTGSAR
ncbi:alpha/beta fold hydrolase [Blastococcus haudaquaticus]|uniref:2-hydroxy-6-oxonona-2,4-dienedioate hydrolase/2-hydroxy-6-oxo-6-(2'-carboxyphenyl)-hexa-2,4-dienoate hydrolase n=1 Tax=Blastococcus haudaquaticus TaxID=1938745 RepID=A0A286GV46_9ACTN|nr:alpha/beta hydrolase [Blastococcus haudaquaticus]SOD99405.1 2-hydroxy-6-oxonona-2,4-dienedioate hydrolase/2-hydroxy-6-oxo-6-(2'-carboxyphenyl)-hexa-2,4-dienoate hydrolase [Blastococcus haudaquaticus]